MIDVYNKQCNDERPGDLAFFTAYTVNVVLPLLASQIVPLPDMISTPNSAK